MVRPGIGVLTVYTPDSWVVIRLDGPEIDPLHKVLAGWHGGFTTGDSWRINSGIKEIRDVGDAYEFVGFSDSVYRCFKGAERLSMYTASILATLQQEAEDTGYTVVQVPVEEVTV